MLSPFGPPGQLVDLALNGDIRLAFDDRTIAELRAVVHRPKLGLPHADVDVVLAQIEAEGLRIVATPIMADWPDPDDAPFVEIASALGVPLVSGNQRHLAVATSLGVTVLTPRQALTLLADRDGCGTA